MNYIDLFHGIGGFALGAYWAGMKFENHFCSDIEPYAQKLYKLRFPESIQLGDITKIDTEALKQYGTEWIITGGFPCQDISIAGKGAGITGARSDLWFEYWRIIRDLRPQFCIMENVGMLIHRGLREVMGSLADIGYNAEWEIIQASDLGAPHQRERVWIMAYPRGDRLETFGEHRGCGEVHKSWSSNKISCLVAEEERWTNAAELVRDFNGLSNRVERLKGLGNAIVPQIAELLFNQIKNYIQEI